MNSIINGISPDTWVSFVSAILTIVLSSTFAAITSYLTTNKSLKNEQIKFEKQIASEIDKIRVQYLYEQKRDNANFLNKFKLEKLAELYELVGQFGRYNAQLSIKIEVLIRSKPLDKISDEEKQIFKSKRAVIENDFFESGTIRTTTICMSYFPVINKKWERTSSMQNRIVSFYPDQLLQLVEVKNPEYEGLKISENYTLNNYLYDLKEVRDGIIEILDDIQAEIVAIMNKMEND